MARFKLTLYDGGFLVVRAWSHENLLSYLRAIKLTDKVKTVNGKEFIPF